MPRTNTITPPSFDDFDGGNQAFTKTQEVSLEGTIAAQDIILGSAWTSLFGLSLIISLILAVGIVYNILRLHQIRKMSKKHYANEPLSRVAQRVFGVTDATSAGSAHNARWKSVMEHVHSENSNDWRQAILEADVMLDDAITTRGYMGEGIGEKLKQVQRGDINSIDDAWEAHKLRNRIAHEGSSLELNQREARRIIGLYERVLHELRHISD